MDIVERLRVRNTPWGWLELTDKAADEIERLRAKLRAIEDQLLSAEQTNWLSASGKRIMEIVRDVEQTAAGDSK